MSDIREFKKDYPSLLWGVKKGTYSMYHEDDVTLLKVRRKVMNQEVTYVFVKSLSGKVYNILSYGKKLPPRTQIQKPDAGTNLYIQIHKSQKEALERINAEAIVRWNNIILT